MDDNVGPPRQQQPLEVQDQFQQLFQELRSQRTEFNALREEVQGNSRTVTSKVDKLTSQKDLVWKFSGNKVQFDFNIDIEENVKQAKWAIQNRKEEYSVELLDTVLKKVKERNKHIRIADTSPGGWDTVKNYLSNPIASDEEDDAKINKAESKAIRHKKEKLGKTPASKRSSTVSRYNPMAANGTSTGRYAGSSGFQADFGKGLGSTFRPSTNYGFGTHTNTSGGASRGPNSGACFGCGEFSHWRNSCPYENRPPRNQQYRKQ